MDLLFSNVTAVTMDAAMHVYPTAFVGVTDGKISYLSQTPPEQKPKKIIDGEGLVLMPGLINCHTQLTMSLLRGYADDCDMPTWLNDTVLPRQDRMDARSAKAAALLSIAECLRFGVTSVSSADVFCGEAAQAVAESGIKANLSYPCTQFTEDLDELRDTGLQKTRNLYETWHGYDHGRIRADACIHAEYTSAYPLWEALAEFAERHGLGMQLPLSQTQAEQESCLERTGLTPAQLLDCHRVFNVRTAAAHCTHLEPDDLALLARRKVSAVHCPTSNAKFANGVADVTAMIRAGMNVCLGTGSPAANNNLDLFETMKIAALLAKTASGNAKELPIPAILMMATVCGARAQGRQAECGQLKVGMDADVILLDFSAPHLIPCHNVLSQLVYAASGHDVVMTVVRGNILYAAGKYATIDLPSVVRELSLHAIGQVFASEQSSRS